MIQIGQQIATVVEHMLQTHERTGNLYVFVIFELDGGDRIPGEIWLTEKSMNMARKSLKAIGFDVDSRNIGELDLDHALLNGQKCQVDIQEEVFKNEARLKVKWINPLPKPKSQTQLDTITKALRAAKSRRPDENGAAEAPEGIVPPAVAHLSKEERDRREAEAAAEDLPF